MDNQPLSENYPDAQIDYAYTNDELNARLNKNNTIAKSISGLLKHVAERITDAGMKMSVEGSTPNPNEFDSSLRNSNSNLTTQNSKLQISNISQKRRFNRRY